MLCAKNFKYLDELIRSGDKEIVLDSDIILSDGEESEYKDGIRLDSDDLTIDGNGHSIDAKGGHIFLNNRKGITLKNITLTNAKNGAIVNSGEMVLYDCTMIANRNCRGNFRDCPPSRIYEHVFGGGAVFNTGRMDFIGCTLSDNTLYNDVSYTAGAGAAIFNLGEISLVDCILSGNASKETGDSEIHENLTFGAAIFSLDGKVDISDCKFRKNVGCFGGAVSGVSSEISITDTRFAENDSGEDFGGAIYVKKCETWISGSKFDSNRAYDGGAICVSEGEMEIHDCIFKSNCASLYDGEGGAIDAGRCRLMIHGGEFLDNEAGYGGAIRLVDCDDDIDAEFYGNEARRWDAVEDSHGLGTNWNND